GYHAIVTSTFFDLYFPSPAPSLIPWSWNASRTYLSIFMLLSWVGWRKEDIEGEKGRVSELAVYSGMGVLTLAFFIFFAFIPLPRAYYPELAFGRPEEFISAAFFLMAFIGYYRKGVWKTDVFEHWVVISLIVGFMGQAMFMSSSFKLFDTMFDAAHLLKKISYLAVLTGLFISIYTTFLTAHRQQSELLKEVADRHHAEAVAHSTSSRLSALIENLHAGILVENNSRHIAVVNQPFCDLFGIPVEPAVLLGTDCSNAAEESKHLFIDPQAFVERIDQILQKREIVIDELLYLVDGRMFERDYIPIFIGDQYEGHAWQYRDITERKKSQEALAESEARLKAIVETASSVIIVIDRNGILEDFNHSAEVIFGYNSSEVMGRNVKMLMPEAYAIEHDGYLNNYHETGDKKIIGIGREVDGRKKDGSIFPMHLSVNEVHLSDRTVYAGIIDDITERVKAEAKLLDYAQKLEWTNMEISDALKRAEEATKAKSSFLASMSHELRTPLNSIIGFSRVILKGIDGPINEMQQQDLDAIYGSGQHLLEMINSILDLSKIEAGKMELSIEEIELHEVVKSVVSTAMGLVKEKPVTIVNNVPEDIPTVHADRTRVRQILLNLLQNATKFTDEGTITVALNKRVNDDGIPELVISVTDTGIGISLEDQKKLFEPFSQVDDSPTRKTGGSGLGLSISRRLVEMQGGEIWLDSIEGEGSTFYFSLPVATDVSHQHAPVVPAKDKKIIISVDDDSKVIDLYNRYLEPHGFQVIAVTDPDSALDQIKSIKPLGITLDIMMPKQDGWQLIEKLKSDPDTKDIPIIICSILDNRDKGYKLGATSYLIKPILEDELVDAINRLDIKQLDTPPNILMIDDDRNAMRLVNKVLSSEGEYNLSFAEGGIAGLAKIQSSPPDAVILDLYMPDLDGFSLLESIRTDPALKSLPVIVLTGGDLSEEQLAELSNKKQAILRKDSLDGDSLINCLQELLSEKPTH
ncbi:MAG: PAS domain S-box protein, partial [Chloroflexi bacterium]|nr:PAS domain S-box protein [Chloroflexota bacterium]